MTHIKNILAVGLIVLTAQSAFATLDYKSNKMPSAADEYILRNPPAVVRHTVNAENCPKKAQAALLMASNGKGNTGATLKTTQSSSDAN